MVHVFLLMVYLGAGDAQRLVSADMYFYSIDDCNYFASQTVKRYGNYKYLDRMSAKHKATAYCVPKYIEKDSVRVY